MAELSESKLTWLRFIKLDTTDNDVTIELDVPVGDGLTARYVEGVRLDAKASPELQEAATRFAEACVKAVVERDVERDPKCVRCTAACCRYANIPIDEADLERMRAANIPMLVELYEGPRFHGHVGKLQRKSYRGPGEVAMGQACAYLIDGWCSIWNHRPQVCRNYAWWNCVKFEPYPEGFLEEDGKHHLRVIPD